MRYFLRYLGFLLRATNQHGVHSPFIYRFVTRCLYTKTKFRRTKCDRLLFKCIDFFKPRSLCVDPREGALEQHIAATFPEVGFGPGPYDLMVLTKPERMEPLNLKNLLGNVHNDTVLLIYDIHCSKKSEQDWQVLKNLPLVTVTVDVFHCGVVFFRKEQAKEHFKIRL